MKLLTSVLLVALGAPAATFTTHDVEPEPWTRIFGAVNIGLGKDDVSAAVLVAGSDNAKLIDQFAPSRIVVVQGTGDATAQLGFAIRTDKVTVRHILDVHAPKMEILWEQGIEIPRLEAPADFQVFAKEKWSGVPVLAGKKTAGGAILWMATPPGPTGIERYPYLLHAAVDLGLVLPARTANLWAFFDSAYRIRADVDYLAKRWREAGISVLHAAAWHNVESDPVQDAYLSGLIEACHRHGILVYAWLELPHVSERFWADHPEWREKTALGQDAQLDWRKLMNLENLDCRAAVEKAIASLLDRFDWDGVNLAELYFESLEGASNPARFTPMNDIVRANFQQEAGFDPKLLFNSESPFAASRNPEGLRRFLDFRAKLAAHMQTEWLAAIDTDKRRKPYLDVVLTHIDDRFEPGMRDALGADVARTLPVLEKRRETMLVEDPATLWSLGPDRYAKLAAKYTEVALDRNNLAVDINVVERYQDVYPTKKQTGVELLQLVHQAATSFRRVALYFENSIEKQDLALLPVAASAAKVQPLSVDGWTIESSDTTRIAWRGPAELDGRAWPVQTSDCVLVPPGRHSLTPGLQSGPVTIEDFNGEIRSVAAGASGMLI